MPLGQRSELWKLEEDPGPAQGLVEAQLSGAGEDEVPRAPSSSSASASSSPPPHLAPALPCFWSPRRRGLLLGSRAAGAWRQPDQGSSSSDEEGSSPWEEPEVTQPSLQDELHLKVAALVGFLLLKYRNKQPTRQAEMLEIVSQDYQDDFPVILGQASECMRLVFGVDVKEVDLSNHSYILVTVLGLTCDGMLSGEQGLPKTSLLVLLLGVTLVEDNCAPEGEVWEALGVMGVFAGKQHIIYGEPRELLTKVWVQEGYLEFRQVPGSDPAHYEFPWGPRAHAKTSKLQVLEYLLRVNRRQPGSSLILSEGALSDEGEGA
ncbi:PREDICTED: melanoma-associated antigen 9-like [Odobenus rosmarus divergens]|uniref:Melanoma-associated antigen 9-like n=1 Tax=Odobenus rosmarus divergens TaxID=9708 RepID=A0A9B0H9D0_ODORO